MKSLNMKYIGTVMVSLMTFAITSFSQNIEEITKMSAIHDFSINTRGGKAPN